MTTLIRVLVIGFALVLALMAAAAIIGVSNARSAAASADSLVSDQLLIVQLLDQVESEQNVLTAAIYRLSGDPGEVDRERMLGDLDETDRDIARIASQGANGPNADSLARLQHAVLDFSAEARQLLQGDIPAGASQDLLVRHEAVTREVARLVDSSYARAVETRQRVDRQTDVLVRDTKLLLGGCLLIALVCAGITVRIAARVFREMEAQSSELSRVSFRLLETQESTARRFAHELHDELGGALTAIKSNLLAIGNSSGTAESKIEDCLKLVDQSISNVRELSQLLRPTILDDFGLDASLRWLTERFAERTGVEIEYRSEFTGRLADETETHLFRIVQEALTNVARHSGATKVSIHLRAEGDSIRLTLSDNGRGMAAVSNGGGMGLSGMRARARSAGGTLKVDSQPSKGVKIEVAAPLEKQAVETIHGEIK